MENKQRISLENLREAAKNHATSCDLGYQSTSL